MRRLSYGLALPDGGPRGLAWPASCSELGEEASCAASARTADGRIRRGGGRETLACREPGSTDDGSHEVFV